MSFQSVLEADQAVHATVGTVFLLPALFALALIDLRHLRLPDRGTLPLLCAGLVWSAWMELDLPISAAIAAAVGYGFFAVFGAIFYRVRGQEGLGLGDAKLMAAGGAWLTPADLPWVVLISSLGALFFALAQRNRMAPLAFGPWIALGIACLWLLRVVQVL